MSTSGIIFLILSIIGFALILARGCGFVHPRFEFMALGIALLVLLGIIAVATGMVTL